MGWEIKLNYHELPEKCVIIIVPHTSWHDFYIGLLVRRILAIEVNYVAKRELFQSPFGWYFRWMGGAPIDRTPGQKKVDAIAGIFKKKNRFRLAIAPEGTRKKVEEWKTGFYYIAQKAEVPIIMVAFDFGKREVNVSAPFDPTGDRESDFREIRSFYRGVVGKVPQYT